MFLNQIQNLNIILIISLFSSLFLSLFFGYLFINKFNFLRSKVREYTPDSHQLKNDTPTMGGIFILLSFIITIFLCCNVLENYVWIFLICIIGFGLIGFWDDICKIRYGKGIKEKTKFQFQISVGLFSTFLWVIFFRPSTVVMIPFIKSLNIDIGWGIIPWATLVLLATSNAVNLTDGLDGLAVSTLIPNFLVFSVISYFFIDHKMISDLYCLANMNGQMTIVGISFIGSLLGFLYYNIYPARVFMGDVGSLSLGAGLAFMAIIIRHEILLVLSGGIFVLETLSVIIQVCSYKLRGKKIFKMAPIHHHFELMGWPESIIFKRWTMITIILSLASILVIR